MRICDCGKSVETGWSGAAGLHPASRLCLICQTARIMASFVYPLKPLNPLKRSKKGTPPHMATKITVTLAPVDGRAPREYMAQSIALLSALSTPTDKVVLTISCEDEDAESYADDIDAALSGRPMGVDAVIKTTSEHHIERRKLASITPMDAFLRDAVER